MSWFHNVIAPRIAPSSALLTPWSRLSDQSCSRLASSGDRCVKRAIVLARGRSGKALKSNECDKNDIRFIICSHIVAWPRPVTVEKFLIRSYRNEQFGAGISNRSSRIAMFHLENVSLSLEIRYIEWYIERSMHTNVMMIRKSLLSSLCNNTTRVFTFRYDVHALIFFYYQNQC